MKNRFIKIVSFALITTTFALGCTKKETIVSGQSNPARGAAPVPVPASEDQIVIFEDPNLEQCVKDTQIGRTEIREPIYADSNGDGILTVEEAMKVTHLECIKKYIRSMDGIEALVNLEYLNCSANELGVLPELSKLPNLRELRCVNNFFTDADCAELDRIRANGTWVAEIELQADDRLLTCDQARLVGHIPPAANEEGHEKNRRGGETARTLNDVWGFVQNGQQYVVYGDVTDIHIVRVLNEEPYYEKVSSMARGYRLKNEDDKEQTEGNPHEGSQCEGPVSDNPDLVGVTKLWSHPNHSIWGEYRYFEKNGRSYLYASTEGNWFGKPDTAEDRQESDMAHLQIFDVTDIRCPKYLDSRDMHVGLRSIHNITVDTERGLLVALGGTDHDGPLNKYGRHRAWRGARIYDLNKNPEQPEYLMTVGDLYVHDAQIKTQKMDDGTIRTLFYSAHGSDGIHWDANTTRDEENRLAVYDISTLKQDEVKVLLSQQYPYGYAHNIWSSDDNRYIIATGENSLKKQLSFWELVVQDDGTLKAEFRNGLNLQGGALAHNAFIRGNHVYASHYSKGVQVMDIFLTPDGKKNVRQKWAYDTFPSNDIGETVGCWGVYPFAELTPELFFATDSETGFYIFRKSSGFLAEERSEQ